MEYSSFRDDGRDGDDGDGDDGDGDDGDGDDSDGDLPVAYTSISSTTVQNNLGSRSLDPRDSPGLIVKLTIHEGMLSISSSPSLSKSGTLKYVSRIPTAATSCLFIASKTIIYL